ncbi:MAG: hypothetical protein VW548_04280 [Methylotenera sp.]
MMLLISICGSISAWQFYQHQANTLRILQQQLSSLESQQRVRYRQQKLLIDYLPQYRSLLQSGLIGQHQPILWLQQLQQIQQSNHLFPVQYSLSKPQTYSIPLYGVRPIASTMKFEMALLHEEDLLTLLNGLKSSQSGGFLLRSCILSQLSVSEEHMQLLKPHLKAKCELDWLSITPLAALDNMP